MYKKELVEKIIKEGVFFKKISTIKNISEKWLPIQF